MKINEINQPKKIIEGSFLDLLLGPDLAGKFDKKNRHEEAERIFLNDFIDDATTSLQNGIKSGLVDPNLYSSTSSVEDSTEVDPSSISEPESPKTAGSARANTSGTQNKSQQQTSQNINNYVRNVAQTLNRTTDRNQKIALVKELVNTMADRHGTPEWNNVVSGIQKILKGSKLDPNFANAAINNLKTGKTISETWRIYFANKLVEATGLTWNKLGLCVLKEGAEYYVVDKKYAKLNFIFENIMESDGAQSITDYLTEWFNLYMNGVDWQAKQSIVLPAIEEVGKTYKVDQGRAALEKLGRLAFALSGPAGQPPAGAKDIRSSAAPASPRKKTDPDQLAADLAAQNPKVRQQIIDKVEKATKA